VTSENTIHNLMSLLKIPRKLSCDTKPEIEFFASHFRKITNPPKHMKSFSFSVIICHKSLKIDSEDSLDDGLQTGRSICSQRKRFLHSDQKGIKK
jgi:hypothetical protein